MGSPGASPLSGAPPVARWEKAVVLLAVCAALLLGGMNLAGPSLWHDELVHVFVAKSIAETGRPALPSGNAYGSAPLYSAILAAVIEAFGDGEAAVRFPSVLFGAVNVVLVFAVLRPLLGRATALVAAVALAVSPWSVAWSREARYYACQQTLYLVTLLAVWQVFVREGRKVAAGFALLAALAYVCAVFTALHSVLFLGPIGAYAALMAVRDERVRARAAMVCCAAAVAGALTMLGYRLFLPYGDAMAVFKEVGIGGKLTDAARGGRSFYLRWLWQNLSTGFFGLAMVGFALMVWRERRRGLWAALAFWAPVGALTFLIAYRRPRNMYFAFPFYVAAFSYGLVQIARFMTTARRSWWRAMGAVVLAVFLARLAVSAGSLTQDSVRVAEGAHVTLARRHPQWRGPCRYVRARLDGRTAVLSTTWIPVFYYVGQIDDWFPSKCIPWEWWETGSDGLKDVADLEAFIAAHPKGYFLAEWWRFDVFDEVAEERAWVQTHMTRVDEGSSPDVTLYAWGMGQEAAATPATAPKAGS